jgi:hypothetical protein
MRSHRRIAVTATFIAALALVPAAEAALPKFSSKVIVVNKSIAGVKVGGAFPASRKAWGGGGVCEPNTCWWRLKPQDLSKGEARFSSVDGKTVSSVQLDLPPDANGKFNFKTPLAKVKTDKGIGIGSTVKQLKKAYPKAKSLGGGTSFMIKKGSRETTFVVWAQIKKVRGITIVNRPTR